MSLLKKKYTIDQVAEGLYLLAASNDILDTSMLFYTRGANKLDTTFHTKLRWHTLTLHLFVCDYACFRRFGNSATKRNILDAFYKQIAYNLSGEENGQGITKAVIAEINSYGTAVAGKSTDDFLASVGKVFADSMDEPPESLLLMLAGSGIFTQFSLTVQQWLDDVNIV